MQVTGLSHVEVLFLCLLAAVSALAALAKRIAVPYPIILVIGGLFLSLIPDAPRVALDPDVVFLVFLPPLLFSAAFQISWREFRHNFSRIFMLAFGLVGFTIFGVALFTRWLFPGFDWKLGLVLGSVVATTDPISATATARRLGIPRKITDLIEAESLVNDGSGLVALKFTAALVVIGVTPSFFEGVGELAYLIAAGVVIGMAVALVVYQIQARISESPIEITISIVTPYIAYLAAEAAHCSGVMATLACGIYLGRRSSGYYSLHARIEASAVWQTLDFILNGIVFLVLGLQLPTILSEIRGMPTSVLIFDAIAFVLLVIALRLVWVYPSAWFTARLRRFFHIRNPNTFTWREIFIVGWAGMRGVLALAAAMSLPERLNTGQPFPHRNLIIFLTFCVIFATLVLQGLSLPALIRHLGLAGAQSSEEEEELARREMISAAIAKLDQLREESGSKENETLDQLELIYRRRMALLDNREPTHGHVSHSDLVSYELLAKQLRAVEREVALRLRDENKIHDEVLRTVERELDLLDARFAPASR